MFSWRKEKADRLQAEHREATLKRLAEVMGLPEVAFEASEASKQAPFETALEMNGEPGFGGAC